MADNDMWQSTKGNVSRVGSGRDGNSGTSIYGSGASRNADGTSGATLFDRIPPHDVDAEMAVLGGMLMSKDAIGEVSQVLETEDFYLPQHQTIYDAILTLFAGSQPVDVVLVANELMKACLLYTSPSPRD